MRKLCLVALMVVFSLSSYGQDIQFGATAGFLSASQKVDIGFGSVRVSESGFYGGMFAEFTLSDEFRIQPELLYANINDFDLLQLPVMAKYYVAEQINVQGGLQFNYILEKRPPNFSAFSVGLGLGAGYDITEDFLAAIRYTFQLNDNYTGDDDFSSKLNILSIGLGYRF